MYAPVHKTLLNEEVDRSNSHIFEPYTALDIVGIAASAGGIEALRELLGGLPGDFPCPIIVVQHLCSAAQHKSVLDRILGNRTLLKVKWAEHGAPLRAGHVFLAPQDRHVAIAPDRTIRLVRAEKMNGVRPAADPLFASIAKHFGARSAAVILSGFLRDGAEGAYKIAAGGGRVFVQDCDSALVREMPEAAIRTGAVHFVLSPFMISRALTALAMAPGAAAWFRVWPKALIRPERSSYIPQPV